MRAIILLVLFAARVAYAEPPDGYECSPGKPKKGVGCECPGGYLPGRDANNYAVCKRITDHRIALTVDSVPRKAAVIVDDTQQGTTPFTVKLEAGSHKIRVTLDGHAPWEQIVEVDAKNRSFIATLVKLGTIAVTADTPGAELVLDGRTDARHPPVDLSLPPGRYQIVLKKPGFTTFERWVDLVAGQRVELKATLPEERAAVFVGASTAGTSVEIDGQLYTGTPGVPTNTRTWKANLLPGRHRIVVKKPSHRSYETSIEVVAGKEYQVEATLRGFGTLAVTAADAPASVEVAIDGKPAGTAPLSREVDSAAYTVAITWSKPRECIHTAQRDELTCTTWKAEPGTSQTVQVGPGERKEVVFRFVKDHETVDAAKADGDEPEITLRKLPAIEHPDDFDPIPKPVKATAPPEEPKPKKPPWTDNFEQAQPAEGDSQSAVTRNFDRFTRGLSSFAAFPLRRRMYTADASVRYPGGLELRMTFGRARAGADDPKRNGKGYDIGLGARSDLYVHEALLHLRVLVKQWLPDAGGVASGPTGLGLFAAVSAGGGADGQRTFGARGGLALARRTESGVVATLRGYVDTWSDRLCDGARGPVGCIAASDRARGLLGISAADDYTAAIAKARTGTQLFGSLVLELPLRHSASVFVEGAYTPMGERPRMTTTFNRSDFVGERDEGWRVAIGITGRVRTFE